MLLNGMGNAGDKMLNEKAGYKFLYNARFQNTYSHRKMLESSKMFAIFCMYNNWIAIIFLVFFPFCILYYNN